MENQIPKPAQKPPSNKNAWFGKIETKEEALKAIKDASNGFYFLAVLQITVGYFFLGVLVMIDGVIFAILAFLLRKFNSTAVAVLLLLLTIVGAVVTGINKFEGGAGGKNVILAVIIILMSVRAMQATIKLHKLEKYKQVAAR